MSDTVVQTAEAKFETILERLEGIGDKLESGDTPLEDALSLFEEGVRLYKAGNNRLDEAEARLEILQQGDKAEPLNLSDSNRASSTNEKF